jgi:hypothetical protein
VGFEHPYPDKQIASFDFECVETDAKWMVLGITLSDGPMFLPQWNDVSSGMPNNWGAAALIAAIVEGLAGVTDKGAAFNRACITPRWAAMGIHSAKVTVRYPASQGYIRYEYSHDEAGRSAIIDFTGSAEEYEAALLMPTGIAPGRVSLNGGEVKVEIKAVESSRYAVVRVNGARAHRLVIEFTKQAKNL